MKKKIVQAMFVILFFLLGIFSCAAIVKGYTEHFLLLFVDVIMIYINAIELRKDN